MFVEKARMVVDSDNSRGVWQVAFKAEVFIRGGRGGGWEIARGNIKTSAAEKSTAKSSINEPE